MMGGGGGGIRAAAWTAAWAAVWTAAGASGATGQMDVADGRLSGPRGRRLSGRRRLGLLDL